MTLQAVELAERAIVKMAKKRCGGHTGAHVQVLRCSYHASLAALSLFALKNSPEHTSHTAHSCNSQAQLLVDGERHHRGQEGDPTEEANVLPFASFGWVTGCHEHSGVVELIDSGRTARGRGGQHSSR